ncbi:hypothetical protein BDD12DRAFT_881840 [Trichophaea hybrida]|nr:hypothetical protein BDD12DRAFT_881840 [Trichophaea hybrida]
MPSTSPTSALTPSLTTLTSLITHCRTSLQNPIYTSPPLTTTPLTLLHSTATLAKAHTTRLSISLRPPITIDAAKKDLSDLTTSIIPSLVAGVSSCDPSIHGAALADEVRGAVDVLLGAIAEFVRGTEGGGW